MIGRLVTGAGVLLASTLPAFAHLDTLEHGSLLAGLSHPLFGADHVLAMVAVGLWAALLSSAHGDRSPLWRVPAAFVTAMTAGFAAALAGLPLPFVEPAILASVMVVGLLAAAALSVPTPAAMALVGFFALFHGHAHGAELGTAGAAAFGVGFAAATALLHGAGMLLGLGLRGLGGATGSAAMRIAGALTALGGVLLAVG